jgi:hypothetical protein
VERSGINTAEGDKEKEGTKRFRESFWFLAGDFGEAAGA